MNHSLEIERVWILDGLPEIPSDAECWRIRQGYLLEHGETDPFHDNPDVAPVTGRIRSIECADGSMRYVHTVKHGEGLVRRERERSISVDAFETAWEGTKGRRLEKTRWRVKHGEHTWEIDHFERLKLVLVEVELSQVEENPTMPEWLLGRIVREVTEEPEYRNVAIAARQGLLGD